MKDVHKLELAANKLRLLASQDKINIIYLLLENGRLTETQIFTKLNIYQSLASTNLSALRRIGILNRVYQDRKILYSVNENVVEEYIKITEELGKESR
jgi:predicted transcriptional regulator